MKPVSGHFNHVIHIFDGTDTEDCVKFGVSYLGNARSCTADIVKTKTTSRSAAFLQNTHFIVILKILYLLSHVLCRQCCLHMLNRVFS